MALLLNVDLGNGIPVVKNAYLRVQNAKVISKVDGVRRAAFEVHYYASSETTASGQNIRTPEYRQFTYEGGDIDEEAYSYLKTLPEYKDAVDA